MDNELNESVSVDVKKIRLTHRYHLLGSDCLVEPEDSRPLLAKIMDVSSAGALIHAGRSIGRVGDVVEVYFRMNINDTEQVFNLKSVIKSVRVEEGSDSVMCGVEFFNVDSELDLLLKNYIYKSLTE